MAVDTSEKFVGDFFQVKMPSATELLPRVVCSSSQQALVKAAFCYTTRHQSPGHQQGSSGGEPFFQSLSAFASDPRRRANAPVNNYSELSFRNLAPQRSWDGLSERVI